MLKKKVAEDIWEEINLWLSENVKENTNYTVFGTGGNINNMHKLLGKRGSETIQTHELKALSADLRSMTLSQRIAKYQLKSDRADVIVPA